MHSGELHLPNLSITNFRGIRQLSINKLERVTLIAGRNGVGKTTVLEAVRVYAARGDQGVLQEIPYSGEEFTEIFDEDQDRVISPDYSALFFGRNATPDQSVSIGPTTCEYSLRIEAVDVKGIPKPQQDWLSEFNSETTQVLRVVYRDAEFLLPWLHNPSGFSGHDLVRPIPRAFLRHKASKRDMPNPINCESIGTGLLGNHVLASYWDKVVLTPEQPFVLRALALSGQNIEAVAVVGDRGGYRSPGRRITVKIRDQIQPIPLKSLGDGISRLFTASLALAVSRNGFLLIDEVANGIHHSIQYEFWSMILKAAHDYNVQVLATTHSFDCIKAFASAASKVEESEGVLIRLEGENGDLRAIEYTGTELEIASDQGIEVR